jgi:hypothetical protein
MLLRYKGAANLPTTGNTYMSASSSLHCEKPSNSHVDNGSAELNVVGVGKGPTPPPPDIWFSGPAVIQIRFRQGFLKYLLAHTQFNI